MLLANVISILEQSALCKANISVQILNGTPTALITFDDSNASATDSNEIQMLRQALVQPIVVKGNNLDEEIIEHLAHGSDKLIEVSEDLKKASKQKSKQKKASKGNKATQPSQASSSIEHTEKSTSSDTKPSKVEVQETSQPDISAMVDMSSFSL